MSGWEGEELEEVLDEVAEYGWREDAILIAAVFFILVVLIAIPPYVPLAPLQTDRVHLKLRLSRSQ